MISSTTILRAPEDRHMHCKPENVWQYSTRETEKGDLNHSMDIIQKLAEAYNSGIPLPPSCIPVGTHNDSE